MYFKFSFVLKCILNDRLKNMKKYLQLHQTWNKYLQLFLKMKTYVRKTF